MKKNNGLTLAVVKKYCPGCRGKTVKNKKTADVLLVEERCEKHKEHHYEPLGVGNLLVKPEHLPRFREMLTLPSFVM